MHRDLARMRRPTAALSPRRLRLRGVLSTEQLLASRTYGLKGQPDAEVSAELVTGHNTVVAEVPLPFDLKTGKRTGHNAIVHEAQLLVYSLLLSEKHGTRWIESSPS